MSTPEIDITNAKMKDLKAWANDLGLEKLAKSDDQDKLARGLLIEADGFKFNTLDEDFQTFLTDNGYDEDGNPPKWVAKAKSNGHAEESEDDEAPKKAKKAKDEDEEDEAPRKSKKAAKDEDDEDEAPRKGKKAKDENLPAKREDAEEAPLKLSKEQKAELKTLRDGIVETYNDFKVAADKLQMDSVWKLGQQVDKIRKITGAGGHLIATLKDLFDNDSIAKDKRINYSVLNDCYRTVLQFKGKRELLEGLNMSKLKSLLTASDPVKIAENGVKNPETGKKVKIQDVTTTAEVIRKGIQAILNPEGGPSAKGRKMRRSHVFGYLKKVVTFKAKLAKFIDKDGDATWSPSEEKKGTEIYNAAKPVINYIARAIGMPEIPDKED